jgi:hypothetical protein
MTILRLSPISRFLLGCSLILGLANTASGDPVTTSTLGWAVNGIVSEVARLGNIAYVGGSFATVSPSANLVYNFATFSTDSAVPVLPRLEVNGRVRAVVALPGGGWIIGGEFTRIGETARGRLARLLPDGSVDSSFTASANGTVWALAVLGSKVYLGGEFTRVDDVERNRLAALDAATGTLDATFAPSVTGGSGPTVCTLIAGSGTVYFGGTFSLVNGTSQMNLGAVNATTGALAGTFTGEADGRVNLLQAGGSSLFAAGEFHTIGGASRHGVAKLDATTGAAVTAFDANANGAVSALAVGGATLFVGGTFGEIGGETRKHLAQLDATTGAATAWNPGANGHVEALALAGTALVAAGHFHEIGGAERLSVAALDTTSPTDMALPWNPSLNSSADMLYLDPAGHVFLGGHFHFFGAVLRENLAAIDLLTGDLLPWNPGANGWIRALDVSGHTVYIGGDFTKIGGESRSRIAAVDGITGRVGEWTANPNGPVKSLMVARDAVYFVGSFSQIKNSTARGRGAAVGLDGTILPWNPAANQTIESLAVVDDLVYVGGQFATLDGQPRVRLGAVSATTGSPTLTFTPDVDGTVYRVDAQDGLLFFGGDFDLVDGSTRHNAAAVKIMPGTSEDGDLVAWNPNVGGPVYDIDAFGDDVYLVGGFGSVGGTSRPGIAMVDALATGGALRAWKPEDVSGGAVSVIDTSDTAVLFGGLLHNLDGIEIGAVLYPEANLPGVPPPPTTPDVLVRGSALRIDWSPPPLGARPSAYVIEGGSGPGRTDLANFSTGNTNTTFSASGLPAGTYYLRMRSRNALGAGAASREQAFVVGAAGCSGPPEPPLDLVAVVTGNTVTLSWRAAAQSIATAYRLVVGSGSGASDLGSFDVGSATSFTANAPDGAYFVRAVAMNPCGVGAPSGETAVVVGNAVVPPGPVFALEGGASGSTVSLSWAAPSVGSGPFQFRIEAGSGPDGANLATITVAGTTFTTAGVPPGVYYVRVRAVGAGGVGPASNEIVIAVQ